MTHSKKSSGKGPSDNRQSSLIADDLRDDPRVAQAKRLLLEALHDHQKKITGIKEADPKEKLSFEALLEEAKAGRGHPLYYKYVGSGIGHKALVELADGSVKYDLANGIGVYFGHSLPFLTEAAIDAALDDTITQGNLQQNREAISLMTRLSKLSGLDHCFLSTSGAMACENALKVAIQHREPASRVLAFDRCFMGRTLTLSQVTDKDKYRDGLPLNFPVDYVPFFDAADPKGSTERAVAALKHHIHRYPGKHCVMAMELIQGEGGAYAGDRDFFLALAKVLKENNILFLADEVQTFGRSHELFAFQHFGLEEVVDIVTIGKLAQVCATLFRKEILPRPGLLSQTFISSSSAIRASHAILDEMEEGDYFGADGKNARLHRAFQERIEALAAKHPGQLEGPYGLGLMFGFTPYGGDPKRVLDLTHRLYDAGVITFICGGHPLRMRFLLPAASLEESDIDTIMKIVEQEFEAGL